MRVLGIMSSPRRGGNSELAAKEILNTLPDSWEKAMINIKRSRHQNMYRLLCLCPAGLSVQTQRRSGLSRRTGPSGG